MTGLVRDPAPDDPAVAELRRRLDAFYATTTDYFAFAATQPRDPLYRLLDPLLAPIVKGAGVVRVLELGAGRTDYPRYLRDAAVPVRFHAQDVTPSNRAYLEPLCDAVHIGDVGELAGEFDLILSTYVFEHVSAPRGFLEQVRRLLAVGGWHVIICPRYDVPGYLCPSLRHLPLPRQAAVTARLVASRLAAAIDGQPRFWVNSDPSVFHGPWYRDADAVHLVSRGDVERWHRAHGFAVRRLHLPHEGLRQFVLHRWLTLSTGFRKLQD